MYERGLWGGRKWVGWLSEGNGEEGRLGWAMEREALGAGEM